MPKRKRKLLITASNCIACGVCEGECPFEAIHVEGDVAVIDYEKCTGCGKCIKVCPTNCLYFEGEKPTEEAPPEAAEEVVPKLGEYRGVWVYVEQNNGQVHPVSWELLGKGRELADARDCELAAMVLGEGVERVAVQAGHYGADKAYIIDDPLLAHYRTYPYAEGCLKLIRRLAHRTDCRLYRPGD